MSTQLGKVDIIHFTNDGELKVGEVALNDDNTLDGFLFEHEVLCRLISDKPNLVKLAVIIHQAHPQEEIKDGG